MHSANLQLVKLFLPGNLEGLYVSHHEPLSKLKLVWLQIVKQGNKVEI